MANGSSISVIDERIKWDENVEEVTAAAGL
jgi:hypothetical protein